MTDSRLWLDILSYCFSSISLSLSLSLSIPVMMWWWEPGSRQRVPVHIPKTPAAFTTYCSSACWLAAGDITGEQNKPWKVWLHCLHGWEQQVVNKQLSPLPSRFTPVYNERHKGSSQSNHLSPERKGCAFTTERTQAFCALKIQTSFVWFCFVLQKHLIL